MLDLRIRGRKALVCAASKGLGRACAMSLARAGVELTITARTAETLERTAEEIRKETGAKVMAVPGDISTEAGRAAALAACPNPDILVNNCGGPPQLFTRMSGLGQAASAAARPASVEMSPGTAVTLAPVSFRISAAVCSRVSSVRAVIVNSTPARPSDIAQARPNPLLAAQTRALRPLMRKSNMWSSSGE